MSKFGKLAAVDVESPRELKLANPFTGLPITSADGKTVSTIRLYSADSKKAQDFERQLLDAQILSKTKRDAEKTETEMLLRLAVLTEGWELFDLDGTPLDVECTQKNASDLYRELPWVYEQVVDFTRSRNNFKKS